MKFYKYWQKYQHTQHGKNTEAWGWSDESLEAALAKGKERALKQFDAIFINGESKLRSFYYAANPMREEILEEIKNESNETIAILSINSYGAVILNTQDMMFVDVDDTVEEYSISNMFKNLFRSKEKRSKKFREQLEEKIQNYTTQNIGTGIRLYKTAKGYRLLIHSHPISSDTPEAKKILQYFEADPLYARLCLSQKCFRARLTPKFFRLDVPMPKPPYQYPYPQDKLVEVKQWKIEYQKHSANFATCQFLGQYGNDTVYPEFVKLMDLHDQMSRVNEGLALA